MEYENKCNGNNGSSLDITVCNISYVHVEIFIELYTTLSVLIMACHVLIQHGKPWLKPIIAWSHLWFNTFFDKKMCEIVELERYGQLYNRLRGKMSCCYGLFA